MENNILTLNMSELIITVLSTSRTHRTGAHPDSRSVYYTLTTASSVADNGNIYNDHVIIYLGAADANSTKDSYPLASGELDYLSVTSALLTDVYFNALWVPLAKVQLKR